jgi:hypothetical protein
MDRTHWRVECVYDPLVEESHTLPRHLPNSPLIRVIPLLPIPFPYHHTDRMDRERPRYLELPVQPSNAHNALETPVCIAQTWMRFIAITDPGAALQTQGSRGGYPGGISCATTPRSRLGQHQ